MALHRVVKWHRPDLKRFLVAGPIAIAACAPGSAIPPPARVVIPAFNLDSLARDSTGVIFSALVGTVQDSASGRALGGAQVLLHSAMGFETYYSYTDDFGGYVVKKVPPGAYNVLIRKEGYHPYSGAHSFRPSVVDTVRANLRSALF